MRQPPYTADEIMTVTAARQLRNRSVCFVGIGLPSAACNLARMSHAPDLVLIYSLTESELTLIRLGSHSELF